MSEVTGANPASTGDAVGATGGPSLSSVEKMPVDATGGTSASNAPIDGGAGSNAPPLPGAAVVSGEDGVPSAGQSSMASSSSSIAVKIEKVTNGANAGSVPSANGQAAQGGGASSSGDGSTKTGAPSTDDGGALQASNAPTVTASPPIILRNQTVVKPVVYGSIAFFLGSKATDTATHKWSIYLRGLEDEDMSYFIKRVVFTLHPSCEIPEVICDKPPFVVTQTGWGEFDVKISIFFQDSAKTMVDIIHPLRLYPPGSSSSHSSLLKKPVVYEFYDELLFTEPMSDWYDILNNVPKDIRKDVSDEELRPYFQKVSEVESMKQILAAQTFISKEIEKTCQELVKVQEEMQTLKEPKKDPNTAQAAAAGGGVAPYGDSTDSQQQQHLRPHGYASGAQHHHHQQPPHRGHYAAPGMTHQQQPPQHHHHQQQQQYPGMVG